MQGTRLLTAVALASLGCLPAQTFSEDLAAAQEAIERRQWQEAVQLLLPLAKRAMDDAQRSNIAEKLCTAGDSLQAASMFQDALVAWRAALELNKQIHGEHDDASIANCLTQVGYCLSDLGRPAQALPLHRNSLEMLQRMYGAQDHALVAQSLNNVAYCLKSTGNASDALPIYEAALDMRQRLYSGEDHSETLVSLNNSAACLMALGKPDRALPRFRAALEMGQRLHGDGDHFDVANSLNSLAYCLQILGETERALPLFRSALEMWHDIYEGRVHANIASGFNNVASCLKNLGRPSEALPNYEAALATLRWMFQDDHPLLAHTLNNIAACYLALGQPNEALPRYEEALEIRKRIHIGRDHVDIANSFNNLAECLEVLGRTSQALPLHEAALATLRRIYGETDHALVAESLDNTASCLQDLGQGARALPRYEAAFAMRGRIFGERQHPHLARSRNNIASCLSALGRPEEALEHFEAALAMNRRLSGGKDHRDVATGLNNVAHCLRVLGRGDEALESYESALTMYRGLHEDRAHPDVVTGLNNVGSCLLTLGRPNEALERLEDALAMSERLYSRNDHPRVVLLLDSIASCYSVLDQPVKAISYSESAVAMVERLFEQSRTLSRPLRQSMFDRLKRTSPFERLQQLCVALERNEQAFLTAERSRGRLLLDLFTQQDFDPLAEAERRAQQRGNVAHANRLGALRSELQATHLDISRLRHAMLHADAQQDSEERLDRRRARAEDLAVRQRQLLDERAAAIADVVPAGKIRTVEEIQGVLLPGELFLEFTIAEDTSYLYILPHEGHVEAIPLPNVDEVVDARLPALLAQVSRSQVRPRGRSPGRPLQSDDASAANRSLFKALIPPAVWPRIAESKRVYLAPHRALHRLPFELLEVGADSGRRVLWIDVGPEISYVSSGSSLFWLLRRERDSGPPGSAPKLDLLAVGDPAQAETEPEVPKEGVLVRSVREDTEGSRIGLRPGDVIVRYGGEALVDDNTLRELRQRFDREIEAGARSSDSLALEIWRKGETRKLTVRPGLLGIQVGRGRARFANEALAETQSEATELRTGDFERARRLPRLAGARREVEAIAAAFEARQRKVESLMGTGATESTVTATASSARLLHFACHGIAEEYGGKSLSMLVLALPKRVRADDDGLLTLEDLLQRWAGRLRGCELVVLAACRTNVGPTHRDEAPTALPLGFMFAGASSVISSLWSVDDDSTLALMTDFYGRLLAGETDRLSAFTAARKALRSKYPDPFYWAPFLYMGKPE